MNLLEWARHLFIPRQTNNYKAGILHPAFLSVLVAFFLVSQFGLNYFAFSYPYVLGFATSILPERVIELTNQQRLEIGLNPLQLNGSLNEVAQRKAGDMFAFNYWAHNSPSGRDPWSFFKEVGYNYLYAGENLARDFMNSESVVDAWMASPTHKDNIVSANYTEIGLAVVDGTLDGVETTLVVQVFGKPQPVVVVQRPVQAKEPVRRPELGGASVAEQFQAAFVQTALAQNSGEEVTIPSMLSPFLLTKSISVFFLGLIFGVLLLDVFLVYRRKIVRLSGKNLAHLLFVGTLLLAIILTTQGAIL